MGGGDGPGKQPRGFRAIGVVQGSQVAYLGLHASWVSSFLPFDTDLPCACCKVRILIGPFFFGYRSIMFML